ncbi:MAG: tRNA (guanosine(37)-N1)-methyltransferase TrmD [Armatimonadota bacterium]
MHVDIVTIFPEVFGGFLECSMLKRAREGGALSVEVHDLRDYTDDKHKVVDDYPFGGGPGMVMKPEPWFRAVSALKGGGEARSWVVFFTPQGEQLTQDKVKLLAARDRLLLLCGHYEGVDQRVCDELVDEEVSLGDYVLTGGELPALVLVDAVARLLPGVLGNEESPGDESFADGLLEYPQYTRPRCHAGLEVPEVLLSGHHEEIRKWRRREALRRTRQRRPDLLAQAELTDEDRELLAEIEAAEDG